MITGEFRNALDEKGRVTIPMRMRNAISGSELIITRGIEQCLWLFLPEEWQRFSAGLVNGASLLLKRARLLQRRIIAPAQELTIDKVGRINIPPTLKASISLDRDCIVLGVQRHIEIWDATIYERYLRESEEEFQAAAEQLGGDILL